MALATVALFQRPSCQCSALVDNVFSGPALHLRLLMVRASGARWWDVLGLPTSTPAPGSQISKYGCISSQA